MMPKLSISVPDELWDQARAAAPDLNPSQLVQNALRRYLTAAAQRPPFARVRPSASQADFEQVRQRMAGEARARYERGYQAGLSLTKDLSWGAVDLLANLNWDVNKWVRELESRDPDGDLLWQLLGIEESDIDGIREYLAPSFERESAFRTGWADALRDVWNAVTENEVDLDTEAARTAGGETDDFGFLR
jgi:post-segregation antitoxin (ccd killing protein)